MARGVPELRTHERLRAVGEHLLDVDEDPELRHLALDRARGEKLLVRHERRTPVDAQGVADAGDDEEEPDVRVRKNVPQRVREPVPGALGEEERPFVEDADEAGRVAPRADVARAIREGRREQHERRAVDPLTREVVETVDDLRADEAGRLAEKRAQSLLVADHGGRPRRHEAFTAAMSFTIESLALPNSIVVWGSRNRSLSMPANPGAMERFITTTLFALSTSRIGIP